MTNFLNKNGWTRIGIEGVVIVVSILLAFAIQAWWDEKQERNEAQEMLQSLLEDFQASKLNVDSFRRSTQKKQDSALELIQIGFGLSSPENESSIDQMLDELNGFWTVVPILMGSVDALVLSGNLALVEDAELRDNLASLRTDIEQYQLATKSGYDIWLTVWHPYMQEHGFLPQTYRARDASPGAIWAGWPDFPVAPPVPFDHMEILMDREFQNILHSIWFLQTWVLRILDRADDRLDHSIELLQLELAR